MGINIATAGVPGVLQGGWRQVISSFSQSLGANLVGNGDMETGDPPDGWTAGNNATLDGVADERTGGAGAQCIDVARGGASTNPYAQRTFSTVAGQCLAAGGWGRIDDAQYCEPTFDSGGQTTYLPPSPYIQSSDWVPYEGIAWANGTVSGLRCRAIADTLGQAARFDDQFAQVITPNPVIALPGPDMDIVIDLTLPESDTRIGQCVDVIYRIPGVITDRNFWLARLWRSHGNDNWNVTLYSVAAGVFTNRAELKEVGAPTKLRVKAYGTVHQVMMWHNSEWVPLTDQIDVDYLEDARGFTVIYSGADMEPDAVTITNAQPFGYGLNGTLKIGIDGDSISDPTASYGKWPPMLRAMLEQALSTNVSFYNFADAGDSLLDCLNALPASLAAVADQDDPAVHLLFVGANDCQSAQVEVTWKGRLRSYVETMHAEWPDTDIVITLPWRLGYETECAEIAGWMIDVCGEYAYAYVGPDANDFLAGDDDGDTLTYAGTHPNGLGCYELANWYARRWRSVYGASWDGGSSAALTRTGDAVGLVANAGVDDQVVDNDFDDIFPWSDFSEVTDAAGNVFVRIPKFYIRKTAVGAARTWEVSRWPLPNGGYLPRCFWDFNNGCELDYVDVGKYVASLSGANKLESKAGTYPLINKTIVEMRGYAETNGAGYQQLDIHVVDLLQALMYVEFATLDLQSVMAGYTAGRDTATDLATVAETGVNRIIVANATAAYYAIGQAISIGTSQGGNQIFYGRTITDIVAYDGSNMAIEFDGDPVNIAIGNMLYNTGWRNDFSGWVTASSGSLVSNSTGKYPCVYRGLENLWGNVWQFVDGINVNENQVWVCADADDYASNVFASPYKALSYVCANANGWWSARGYDSGHPYAALPSAVGGGLTMDYYYQNTGQRIALLGGFWRNGSFAGPSCWALSYASSNAYVSIGARLLKKAL